ncbi:MAG: hypothetical protein ACK40G_08680 [Cytophagaceae bacterium]
MKYVSLCFFLFTVLNWFPNLAISQVISDSSKLTRGYYTSFENFRKNVVVPADIYLEYDFFESPDCPKMQYCDNGGIDLFKLKNKEDKRFKTESSIFAVSDGKKLYILSRPADIFSPDVVVQILFLGKYAGYIDLKPGMVTSGQYGATGSTPPKIEECVIDMYTGELIRLNEANMKSILKDYPDIHQEYKNDKKGKTRRLYYIEMINQLLKKN